MRWLLTLPLTLDKQPLLVSSSALSLASECVMGYSLGFFDFAVVPALATEVDEGFAFFIFCSCMCAQVRAHDPENRRHYCD